MPFRVEMTLLAQPTRVSPYSLGLWRCTHKYSPIPQLPASIRVHNVSPPPLI
ncbi:hypothetical protein HanIR_Chr04g0157391 [Helianthus annuus]|nr:hypothetical protein HanIR_Chr04g0157391 [Helianthus annuus]